MAAARQRPAASHATGDGFKLHRRGLRLAGRDHTVIGLRPGTAIRFSTNRYHQTWHVLGDDHSARLLGRLLWGLAYTRRPGTLVVLDLPFLDPNPFDAEPADPVVLVPEDLTGFGTAGARALRGRLPLRSRPDGTVRWHTPGLDLALADPWAWWERGQGDAFWRRGTDGIVEPRGGLLVMRATAPVLRAWAVMVATLSSANRYRTDDARFALGRAGGWWPDGEVQIFADYRRRVGVARVARREVLAAEASARGAEAPASGSTPDDVRQAIWRHGNAVARRRPRPW
jgi:hypothetical protein